LTARQSPAIGKAYRKAKNVVQHSIYAGF
jgi:hypothetical protein